MNETDPPYEDTPLRRRAAKLAAAAGNFPNGLSEDELSRIIYELEIHQIELEMQNEELRRTQQQLSESHDRYADLYEFAPIGYVTLNQEGTIIAANLAAATMLRMERRRLLGRSLKGFIDARYREVIQHHCGRVFSSQHSQVCEIEMHCGDGRPLEVRLESVATGIGPAATCRTALIDQTEQRKPPAKLKD